jgi:hypothetical protein
MVERIKTVVIILLVLSLALLMFVSFSLSAASYPLKPSDMVFELFGRAKKNASGAEEDLRSAAAFPCQIAVSSEGGAYMPQTPSQYDDAFQFVSPYMEEAIGSAGDPSECTADEYKTALSGGGVLFVYDRPLPFYLFYAWYNGGDFDGELSLVSLFACPETDRVRLYVRTPDDRFMRFETESNAGTLKSVCRAFSPNGVFAFALEGAVCDPFSPLPKTPSAASSYLILPPAYGGGSELSRDILDDFSINFYLTSVYNDQSSVVYVEGQNTLRLYDDGRLAYTGSLPSGANPSLQGNAAAADMLSHIYPFASSLWQKTSSGGSALSLSSAELMSDGRAVFTFDAYIGGCTVERETAACTVVTEDGAIVGLSLYRIRLSPYASAPLLPFAQAAAAASPGSSLRMQYLPDGNGYLLPHMRSIKGGDD